MALKKEVAAAAASAVPEAPAPQVSLTLKLELALYTQYHFQGQVFVKGQVYEFSRESAMTLLAEQDCGRPVWKIHRPVVARVRPATPAVQDMTAVAVRPVEAVPSGAPDPAKSLQVGTDDEIADVLAQVEAEDQGENVTV